MATIKPSDIDPFLAAISATLAYNIRAELKEPLMKQAEAYVDEAVDRAIEAIKPNIEAAVSRFDMTTTVKFIIEKHSRDAS